MVYSFLRVLELCYFEQIQNGYNTYSEAFDVLELCYFEQIQNRTKKRSLSR